MARLTREKDEYSCRIKGGCEAEEWMWWKYGEYPDDICKGCPFKKIINKLAEYEDKEDQLKK